MQSYPVPSPSQIRRRSQILAAAARLFAAERYEAVQMEEVARSAGVAKPTLYRYFPTKESLFLETLDAMLVALAEATAGPAYAGLPPREKLARAIRQMVTTLARGAAAVRAMDGNDHGLGDRGRAIIRQRVKAIRGNLIDILQQGQEDGSFRVLDPNLAANAILGAARMTAAHLGSNQSVAAASEQLIDLLTQGLKA